MSSGVTDEMRALSRRFSYRRVAPYATLRDRSLRGKTRIKARKAAQRAAR